MKLIHFKILPSTNDYLKTHHKDHEHLTLLSCDHQTEGRGSHSRIWIDHYDDALFSILLKDSIDIDQLPKMTQFVAYVLHQHLENYHSGFKIKRPNDIYIHGKKIAGILLESIIEGSKVISLVIGIGVNINTTSFDESLNNQATSLKAITQKDHDIKDFIKSFALAFESSYQAFIDQTLDIDTYIENHLYHM